jgi:carbamoyltransferase
LSTYILGISAFYHDSAAALLKDGAIVAAAQEERFTRKKHDPSFPDKAIKYCLEEANIQTSDVDLIVFYEKPFLKFERLVETYLDTAPRCASSFMRSIPLWLSDRLWIPTKLRKELGFRGKLLFMEHHESHAASAFYPSPFEEAAYITADGVGEWATTQFGVGRGKDIFPIAEIYFPHSLGLLYSAFTQYCGFKVNSGEYKLMGLAPYGNPVFVNKILKDIVDVREDGSFQLDTSFFGYQTTLSMINLRFETLFGHPTRKPESELTQHYMDIAKSIQEVTELILMKMVNHVFRQTMMEKLCLAGGVALNCVANSRILNEGPFKDIWIQPASSDAGGALGAALRAWHAFLGQNRETATCGDGMEGAQLGPSYSNGKIVDYLRRHSIPHRMLGTDRVAKETARLISEGNVVGWFQGRMEYGPRALGNRSILGDARNPDMQSKMNLKIKFRESFRPFAPAVLEERVSQWFDMDRPSPYMLLVAKVEESHCLPTSSEQRELEGLDKLSVQRSTIPAVTHVDLSARVQTISKDINPLFHKLVSEFEKLTGCPVIINTSFNVRGEPIVCTPEDAFRCFMRTDMDFLVLGEFLLNKKEQKQVENETSWMREYSLD